MNVAITGMGVVSALGHNAPLLLERLGRNDLAIVETPWTSGSPGHHEWWAPIPDFEPTRYFDERILAGVDPFAQHAVAAAVSAVDDAGLATLDPERAAVVLGTSKAGSQTLERAQYDVEHRGREAVSPKLMIRVWPNMAASHVALRWRLHGPCLTLSTACASSLDAIGLGARLITSGAADVVLAGGTEGGLAFGVGDGEFVPASAYARYGYGMGSDAPTARTVCRPFDRDRSGMVMGEGSGVVVLESEAHAHARGAKVRAWVQGWGTGADSYHPSTPDPSGDWERRVMERALEDAGVDGTAIDAVAAHATGTPKGDLAEIRALNTLLGSRASAVPAMSIKGLLGHPAGAAGALSLIVAIEGMGNDVLVHTGATTDPDPEIDFDVVVDTPRKVSIERLLVNAFGFGGQNASLVIGAA